MGQLPEAEQAGPPPLSSMPARRRLTSNLPVLIGQVGLIALGIGVIVESTALGLWTTLGPGPGLLPLLLGIALVALTGVWVVQSIREGRTAPAESAAAPSAPAESAAAASASAQPADAASPTARASAAEQAERSEQVPAVDTAPADGADIADEEPERLDRFYVGVVLVSLIVLASVIDLLGFQISMTLFLLLHLRWMGRRGWLLSIALAVIGSVGIFVLFDQVLQVPLPLSSLPALSAWGL